MRILFISNGSNFVAAGGMEHHLIDITAWFEGRGVETGLAIRKGTYFHRELLAGRPHVYPLPWTGFSKISSFFALVSAILAFSPDIISINRERDIIRILSIVKCIGPFLEKRPKIVSVFHNSGWKKRRFIMSRIDGTIFPNAYLKNIYAPGETHRNSAVIHHGIHLPQVDQDQKLNPDRDRKYFKGMKFPIIGMVGELRKNQAELIDVAYHLKKRVSEFTVAIVGRGKTEEVKQLQDKIDRLGLRNHFILTGNVERSRMSDIFHDLDISVTTNRREPFGLAFIESLAAHTPLIAYNSGGPVEILEKGGGILVDGGPGEMAARLFRLITDHGERKALSFAGRAAAEKYFSIDAMGEKHFRFYNQILESC